MDKQLMAKILSYFIENYNDLHEKCYSIVISSNSTGIPVSPEGNESFSLEKDFFINCIKKDNDTIFLFKFEAGNFELDKISFDISVAKNPYSLVDHAEIIREKINNQLKDFENMKNLVEKIQYYEPYLDRKAWESPYGPKTRKRRKY